MNTQASDIMTIKSTKRLRKTPALSVLIPYYHDDPRPLLDALSEQCAGRNDIEILVYDDGTKDADLNTQVVAHVKSAPCVVTAIMARENRGRAAARNHLMREARADWVLFLDADMRPESPNFIRDYVSLIGSDTADIIFGGFIVPERAENRDQELHRALSEVSDCLSLMERQQAGAQYVATSNLCVRKQVLETEDFDPQFEGWGWEDSEWAARVSQHFTLLHANIPALHLGLESTDTLLRRFKDSGPNYVRFTSKHPDFAKCLALYDISQKLRRIPGQKVMRPLLRLLVKFHFTPIRLRIAALKLWRASWYAEAFT